MAEITKNRVAAALRAYAEEAHKKAAEGNPDRMTVADGQGGISTHAAQPKPDPALGHLLADVGADGSIRTTKPLPEGGPDRMTVADGQGGISTHAAQPKADPALGDLRHDTSSDSSVRKSASPSERVARIRQALGGGNTAAQPAQKQADSSRPQADSSQPAQDNIQLNRDVLAKIAASALSTEEGASYIFSVLEKQAGREAAQHYIREAMHAAEVIEGVDQVKQAAYADSYNKAEMVYQALDEAGVTEQDADAIIKQAALHQAKLEEFDHPLLKQAYAQGIDDAALLAAADEEVGEGELEEGALDEALPMGGEDLAPEEIIALLGEMVEAGVISEEDVIAALSEGGEEEMLPM
jgi:hypothetical protein